MQMNQDSYLSISVMIVAIHQGAFHCRVKWTDAGSLTTVDMKYGSVGKCVGVKLSQGHVIAEAGKQQTKILDRKYFLT